MAQTGLRVGNPGRKRRFETLDRILDWTDGADSSTASKLGAFRVFVLMQLSAETWVWAVSSNVSPSGLRPVLAAAYTAALVLALAGRRGRLATWFATGLLVVHVLWTFPFTANHRFLLLLCVALLALLDLEKDDEGTLMLQGLRWLMILVLFYSGAQKATYGTYFGGEYLTYQISVSDRFSWLFGPLIPSAELARLTSIGDLVPGAGPFRIDSAILVTVSNLVVLLELVLAVLLVPRKTRSMAATAGIALFVCIQAGARELFFGALAVNMLLLFYDRDLNRRTLPLWAALLATLVAVRLLFPDWSFN